MKGLFDLDNPMMLMLGRIVDLVWLNILTFICSVPIITVGPSMTALHYVTMKIVRGEEGYITVEFFKSFRENWKQSMVHGIVLGLLGGVLVADYMILYRMEEDIKYYIFVAVLLITIILLMTAMYIYPLQARFVNTCKGTIKNAFILSISNLPKTIIMMVVYLFPFIVMYYVPYVMPLVLLLGITLPVYLNSYIFVSIFKKIEEAYLDDEEQTVGESDLLEIE